MSDGDELVHRDFATVRDLIGHARLMTSRAKTKAQRLRASQMTAAAEVARERAGGHLHLLLRDLRDQAWPTSNTRQ